MQPRRAERERADRLGAIEVFADAVDHAGLDQIDDTVGEQLGVDTEVAMVHQGGHDRVRDGADAGLQGGPVGDPFGDVVGDRAVEVVGFAWLDLDERAVRPAPPFDLADVELVAAERARHVFGDLEEEPGPPDEAGRVVGRDAEREVAVAVGR